MKDLDLKKYEVRTDLASEAVEMMVKKNKFNEDLYTKTQIVNNVTIKTTTVDDLLASELGKKPGIYYLIDSTSVLVHDHDDLNDLEDALVFVIKDIMQIEKITPQMVGLIVGLGNINCTPDSLGPLIVDNVIVTRHMFLLDPSKVSPGVSNICAMSPGVMGQTGIETFDIISSVIEKIKVDYVIVCDALASRSVGRCNKTIQVTNTGISPGSGVGANRQELSKETVNIPVIAIGVPTVVDAITIVNDTIEKLMNHFEMQSLNNQMISKNIIGQLSQLSDDEKRELFDEVLTQSGGNYMVTPKEIDLDIEDLSKVISNALDRAIHKIVEES